MSDLNYASLNTFIRIKEMAFLSKGDFENLIKSSNLENAIQILKSTKYANLSLDYEKNLLDCLVKDFSEIKDLLDGPELEIFTLIYTYHNLKVLLKTKLTDINLENVLIPIGYPIESLELLVKDGDPEALPPILVEAVQATIDQYNTYQRVEEIDIILDRAYFDHLYQNAQLIGNATLMKIVCAWIDLYNLSTLWRLKERTISRNFLQTVLADKGQIDKTTLIELALSKQWQEVSILISGTDYERAIKPFISKISEIKSADFDLAKDSVAHYYLQEARLEPFGILPVLAYCYYLDMEIKNLRLILTGKDNLFNENALRERMRPIYDL